MKAAVTRRVATRGTRRLAATSTLYCTPGTLSTLPARWSRSASATTLSGSSHSAAGSRDMSSPARWWNSVCTKPGATADSRTPCGAT